jgi:hypothetical protein
VPSIVLEVGVSVSNPLTGRAEELIAICTVLRRSVELLSQYTIVRVSISEFVGTRIGSLTAQGERRL